MHDRNESHARPRGATPKRASQDTVNHGASAREDLSATAGHKQTGEAARFDREPKSVASISTRHVRGPSDSAVDQISSPASSTAHAQSTDTSRTDGQTPLTAHGEDSESRFQLATEKDKAAALGHGGHSSENLALGSGNKNDSRALHSDARLSPCSLDHQHQSSGLRLEQHVHRDEEPLDSPSRPKRRRRKSTDRVNIVLLKDLLRARSEEMSLQLTKNGFTRLAADGRPLGSRKDYMHLLFLQQALDNSTQSKLSDLLNNSAKALSTNDWETQTRERLDTAIVKRIYELQQRSRWSLRQPKPYPEPKMPVTHQDFVMQEMKWLQVDFREERKYKLYVARQLAYWCKEWVNADPQDRIALRVSSAAGEADELQDLVKEHASFLQDLPILRPLGASSATTSPKQEPESDEKVITETKEENGQPAAAPAEQAATPAAAQPKTSQLPPLPPEEDFCALFDPEWKPLRARVNAHYAFRPPIGQLPTQGFYEHRKASQWLYEDDQQLRGYVRDFPSNWALIADRMASRTMFPSSLDRRTPWECYERLLNLEGQPQDINGRQYVRHFQWQLEKARSKWNATQVAAQQQLQQQAAGQSQSGQQTQAAILNARFPTPMRVERKTNRRYLALLDAVRKLARKRETVANRPAQSFQGKHSRVYACAL